MLTDGDDLVCQPAGAVPQASSMARAVRAIISRSAASSISAWPSQRQPWAEISCPRASASRAIQGLRSTARPELLKVALTP